MHSNNTFNSNPIYVQAYPLPTDETEKRFIKEPPSAPFKTTTNPSTLHTTIPNETAIKEYLTSCKWPTGLQEAFIRNLNKIPVRFFICDDSGSMSLDDGHCLVHFDGVSRFRSCTRWKELSLALSFHAMLRLNFAYSMAQRL